MASDVTPYRVAIYAAPAFGTDWWERGSEWLGRCAFRRSPILSPGIDGVDMAAVAALTAEPRRYGWHATLKAPMRLAAHANLRLLRDSVGELCRSHRVMELPDLQVTRLGGFLALCPAQPPAALAALADDCVQRLQPLAARLSDQELARRRRQQLTAEEDALMRAWGYPWVLQLFRFHFSLTGSLKGVSDHQVDAIERAARAHFDGLPPFCLDRLSIFVEPNAGADLELLEQVELRP